MIGIGLSSTDIPFNDSDPIPTIADWKAATAAERFVGNLGRLNFS